MEEGYVIGAFVGLTKGKKASAWSSKLAVKATKKMGLHAINQSLETSYCDRPSIFQPLERRLLLPESISLSCLQYHN